jgi:hypothetical protein
MTFTPLVSFSINGLAVSIVIRSLIQLPRRHQSCRQIRRVQIPPLPPISPPTTHSLVRPLRFVLLPPLVNLAQSQSYLQDRSPKSVMTKPWGDKYDFLASLSKDGKYQDLLREINEVFLSDVSLFVNHL